MTVSSLPMWCANCSKNSRSIKHTSPVCVCSVQCHRPVTWRLFQFHIGKKRCELTRYVVYAYFPFEKCSLCRLTTWWLKWSNKSHLYHLSSHTYPAVWTGDRTLNRPESLCVCVRLRCGTVSKSPENSVHTRLCNELFSFRRLVQFLFICFASTCAFSVAAKIWIRNERARAHFIRAKLFAG